MRHFSPDMSSESAGFRLLMADELDLIAGGDGEDTDEVNLPPGYSPVGDGSQYMRNDATGKLALTPAWQYAIDHNQIDWWGVANDIAWITASSLAGVLSAPYSYAAGALAAGLDALQ